MLPIDLFKLAIEHLPLFAMDMLVINKQHEILLGKRVNSPAKGYWFVPGGRVFKNEQLADAFKRISKSELGIELPYHKAKLLGLYDHFYPDSIISESISTHYINATHVVEVDVSLFELPSAQHTEYRWIALNELETDSSVHQYSKVFAQALKDYLEHTNR